MPNIQINILNFSDIHLNHKRITPEIIDNIIEMITARKKDIDILTFSGDLLYVPVVFGSKASELVINFLSRLNNIGLPTVMIGGTRSHENQVIEFSGNLGLFPNIKFVDTVEVVEINILNKKVFKLLCLPEEYIKDVEEYYKDTVFSTNTYDMTLLHGNIETFAFTDNDTERDNPKMVNWSPDDLLRSSPLTLAGHYHSSASKDYGDKLIAYTGSITAFDFSDLTEKKMDLATITYDELGNFQSVDIEYIPNHLSPKLKVIQIDATNFTELFKEELYKDIDIKFVIEHSDLSEATIKEFKKLKGVKATVVWKKDFDSYKSANIEDIDRITSLPIPQQINDFAKAELPIEFIEAFSKENFNFNNFKIYF